MKPNAAGWRPMTWESEHFGFPVAALPPADLPMDGLAALLRQARSQGVRLVCWPAPSTSSVPATILSEFRGRLADRKVTYANNLPAPTLQESGTDDRFVIGDYEGAESSPALRSLALAAAGHSRFFRDDGFPRARAEAMYEIWIARSVRRELADAVLVARPAAAPADLCGLATVARTAGPARIGLIAVRPDCRGGGLGRRLMQAAHEFASSSGAQQIEVVTQADNVAACRLYERCGYRRTSLTHYYHFWLQQACQAA